jgi:MFS transporter, DHA2 family, integral membrane protein
MTPDVDEDHLIHERRWRTLAVLCLSLVMVVAGVSSLNVALPAISSGLDASGTELQWMVDAYSLSFAALLLPAGALGDRFGRKGALQFGLLIYAGAALLGSFATDSGQLIATRAVMGLGAAFVMPATLSIITNVFPPHERGKAIATWAGFAGAGGAIGPLLSGLLLESFWWGSVLFISVPLAALALGLGVVLVPTSVDPDHTRLDPGGAVLSAAGLFLVLYAIIEGPNNGWTDIVTLGAFGSGAIVLVGFVLWERSSSTPMLDMAFFSNRGFRAGSFTITIVFFCMFGMFFLVTLYLQFAIGFSALGAAVRTVPIAVMMLLVAPRSATLAEHFGLRNVVTTGMVLMSVGFAVMASLAGGYHYWILLTSLLLLGAGMSVVMANSTTSIMAGLPQAKAGVGSAVNDTSREVGGAVGIAVLGSIVSTMYRASLGDTLSGLPEPAAAAVDDSIGGALRVAQQMGGEAGQQVIEAARSAFTDAFGITMLSAAAAILVGAAITARAMPKQVAVASIAPPVAGDSFRGLSAER